MGNGFFGRRITRRSGISHNEVEDARTEHLTAGADVLLRAMLEQAGVVAPA